jgi:hypothetical protein
LALCGETAPATIGMQTCRPSKPVIDDPGKKEIWAIYQDQDPKPNLSKEEGPQRGLRGRSRGEWEEKREGWTETVIATVTTAATVEIGRD